MNSMKSHLHHTQSEPKGDLGTESATQAGEARKRTGIREGLWSVLLVLALILATSASIYLVGVTGWKWDGITHTAVNGPFTAHAYAGNAMAFVIAALYIRACWRAKVRDWAAMDAQNEALAKLLSEDQRRADEVRASFSTAKRLTPLERSSRSGFTVIELIMVIALMLGAYLVGSLVLEALGWAIPAFSKMLVGGFVVLALLSCLGGGEKKGGK